MNLPLLTFDTGIISPLPASMMLTFDSDGAGGTLEKEGSWLHPVAYDPQQCTYNATQWRSSSSLLFLARHPLPVPQNPGEFPACNALPTTLDLLAPQREAAN